MSGPRLLLDPIDAGRSGAAALFCAFVVVVVGFSACTASGGWSRPSASAETTESPCAGAALTATFRVKNDVTQQGLLDVKDSSTGKVVEYTVEWPPGVHVQGSDLVGPDGRVVAHDGDVLDGIGVCLVQDTHIVVGALPSP